MRFSFSVLIAGIVLVAALNAQSAQTTSQTQTPPAEQQAKRAAAKKAAEPPAKPPEATSPEEQKPTPDDKDKGKEEHFDVRKVRPSSLSTRSR